MSAELRVVSGEEEVPIGEEEAPAGYIDPLIGTMIDGRYEVESVLGEGGMGLVYKVRHKILNKPLAVKVLRPDVSRDEEIITRFRQEAQSASAIGNEHIIDISDFGVLPDGATYFIMEFLDGVDLTAAIERDVQMDPKNIVHVAKQLCRALGAAHEAGIVHRDLKPDNIYLIRRGSDTSFVKVLDFGIAKVGGNSSKLTRAGQVFGTPHYMSPEQCAGSGIDHRTDVYALGVILYEMATGECPFDADNLMGILTKHLYEEPVPPGETVESLPEDLEAVILKAMAKKIDQRYQSMAALLEDLERVEMGVGTVARETTHSMPLEEVAPEPEKSKKGVLITALLLLVGGFGAYFGFAGSETVASPTEPTPTGPGVETDVVVEPDSDPVPDPVSVQPLRVETTPSALVYVNDELIGSTPTEIPRPTDEERIVLSIRKRGYITQEITVSSLTQSPVVLTLEERRRVTMRVPRRMTMRVPRRMTTMQSPRPNVSTEMSGTSSQQSEVLNPWDD